MDGKFSKTGESDSEPARNDVVSAINIAPSSALPSPSRFTAHPPSVLEIVKVLSRLGESDMLTILPHHKDLVEQVLCVIPLLEELAKEVVEGTENAAYSLKSISVQQPADEGLDVSSFTAAVDILSRFRNCVLLNQNAVELDYILSVLIYVERIAKKKVATMLAKVNFGFKISDILELDPSWKPQEPVMPEAKVQSRQGMLKTEMCNNFIHIRSCPYRDRCRFAHGVKELRPVARHPRYKHAVCNSVLDGYVCPYGDRCKFSHSKTATKPRW